jgi:Tol biopolymer transport system component
MMINRFAISLAILPFFLAGCLPIGSPTPETTATRSATTWPTELPRLELVITPGELPVDLDSNVAEPTSEATIQPESSPTPTALPGLRQLTTDGCCTEHFWSPDGQRIFYVDRPSADMPSGLWGVDLLGGETEFVTDQLGIYSADMQLRAFPLNRQTVVERLTSGEQWIIPNDGRAVSFSPNGEWVAWTAGQSEPPFDRAVRQVWVSRTDGTEAQQVFEAVRGGFGGWLPDGRLVVSGLVGEAGTEQAYWAMEIMQSNEGQGVMVELGRGGRLREAKISPDGSWMAYLVSFSQDPNEDGIWVSDTRSGKKRRLEVFGGYNWQDDNQLLVVPLDLNQPVNQLLKVQADTGQVEILTDPEVTPFKIANGDWSVSPRGDQVTFLSAEDGNIWLLEISGEVK